MKVERNFGTSSLSGDAIVTCHVLRWGIESDYASVPHDVVVGANIIALPYNPVALARTFHTLSRPWTRVYILGKARLAGTHAAFKGEMVRLFARVHRVDGSCSWLRSPGVFISCHMDGKMAAGLRWVMVLVIRSDATTSWVKREGGMMRDNIQPADALRGGVATRGDAATSQDKQDGGATRGEVTTNWCVERRWQCPKQRA